MAGRRDRSVTCVQGMTRATLCLRREVHPLEDDLNVSLGRREIHLAEKGLEARVGLQLVSGRICSVLTRRLRLLRSGPIDTAETKQASSQEDVWTGQRADLTVRIAYVCYPHRRNGGNRLIVSGLRSVSDSRQSLL